MTYLVSDIYPKGIRLTAEKLALNAGMTLRRTVFLPWSLYSAMKEGDMEVVNIFIAQRADVNKCMFYTSYESPALTHIAQ
jgi:hypothetical protein